MVNVGPSAGVRESPVGALPLVIRVPWKLTSHRGALDWEDAGLVVVYGPDMADRVATSLTRASSKVNANTNLTAEDLAAEVQAAQAAASTAPDTA